jgi:hypothetical protein
MPLSSDVIVGTWISDIRETKEGPMIFAFRFASKGNLAITGTPTEASQPTFHRAGSYRLEDNQLISPVINGGQPAPVELRADRLHLIIDTLSFSLRRE